jgi:hypothetical protein
VAAVIGLAIGVEMGKYLQIIRRMRKEATLHETRVREEGDIIELSCSCGWAETAFYTTKNITVRSLQRATAERAATRHWSEMLEQARIGGGND